MISRGEVGLIVASVGVSNGLIDTSAFTSVVLMVLAARAGHATLAALGIS